MIKNSTILVTGGAGFIGSNLVSRLTADGNQVVVLDDLSMGSWDNLEDSPQLTKVEGSVTDKGLLEKLLERFNFDYIFHLAAIASVADSVARPYETHQVNFESTLLLIELLRRRKGKLKRLIFSSSAAVYGDEPSLPKTEESPICPLTPYAIDKFASEQMVLAYAQLYGLPTSATRFFNVYGPKQNPKSPYSGFISILVDCLKNDSPLTIFGDGKQSRDFVYVDDVIQALTLVATSHQAVGEVYNVGRGEGSCLNDLVDLVQGYFHKNLMLHYSEPRAGDIHDSLSSITKLSALGYQPQFKLEEGMMQYLEYELKTITVI
jgi:UDP-glucose 4-epimerase